VDLGKTAATSLLPAIQKVRGAAGRVQSQNNLRQLGLAMHSYNDTNRKLPPARLNGGLSWRVAILPFIEQQALYQQFHLNEPWDSPHNIKLLDKMPKTFAPPPGTAAKPNTTFYQVFTGLQTPWNGQMDPTIPATFLDGTSNTFLIVEAGEAVPWTKPDDLVYDATKPLPKLGGIFPGGFNAVMADGAAVWVDQARVAEATIRALITPAGAEPIPFNWQNGGR
jgi:hypothetical protein